MNHYLNLEAAILGAGFYSLFTGYQYISNRTYEPGYNIIYLVRFFLGIVSGMVLSSFELGLPPQYSKIVLGLIGGYSAEAVNQILLRVTEILIAAVKGSGKEDFSQRETLLRAEVRDEQSRQRQRTSTELSDILKDAISNGSPPEVIEKIKKSLDTLSK
jgi:hypothetical protein